MYYIHLVFELSLNIQKMLISKQIFSEEKLYWSFFYRLRTVSNNSQHLTQKIKDNENNVHFQEKVVLPSEQFFFL